MTEAQKLRIYFTILVVLVFAMAIGWSLAINPASTTTLASAIIASAALWLSAALAQLWNPASRHATAILNSLGASSAVYAGLAALQSFGSAT